MDGHTTTPVFKIKKTSMQKQKPKTRRPATKQSKAVAVINNEVPSQLPVKPGHLSLADPEQVMAFGNTLNHYIKKNNLSVMIGNTDYAMVNGWQYAGISFGLTPIVHKPVATHKRGEYQTVLYVDKAFRSKDGKKEWTKEVPIFVGYADDKEVIRQLREQHKIVREMTKPFFAYECECDVVKLSDQQKVGFGVGLCTSMEAAKSSFDEYAVNSMSQTRSIGKAYRNLLSFVMKTAGYGDTPAEEMQPIVDQEAQFYPDEPVQQRKQTCGPDRFKVILQKVTNGDKDGNKGRVVVDEAMKYHTFSESQMKAFEIAIKNLK
jgi:hypothetical protein